MIAKAQSEGKMQRKKSGSQIDIIFYNGDFILALSAISGVAE